MKEYGGTKEACDYCGRDFKFGDEVLVDMARQLIFCYALAGGCATVYETGEVLQLELMRFHGNT